MTTLYYTEKYTIVPIVNGYNPDNSPIVQPQMYMYWDLEPDTPIGPVEGTMSRSIYRVEGEILANYTSPEDCLASFRDGALWALGSYIDTYFPNMYSSYTLVNIKEKPLVLDLRS